MKYLYFLLIFLISCSYEHVTSSFSDDDIIWKGYLNEDSTLLKGFNSTMSCLEYCGPDSFTIPKNYPYIIVVKVDKILCRSNYVDGCYSHDNKIIYIVEAKLHSAVLSHEIVHWATGVRNESAQFLIMCSVDVWW